MSQNIFKIDPIFFLPIDFEENSKIISEQKQKDIMSNNNIEKYRKKSHKKNKINLEDEATNENSSSGKEMDRSLEINKNKNSNKGKLERKEKEEEEEKDYIVFSKSANDRNIKSLTNSSKIYISEIFKQNWKLKSRRLITKLKKKLIKQYKNSYLQEISDNRYNDYMNINFKYKNQDINNSNKIYLNYKNNFIYNNVRNNVNNHIICNDINDKKFLNIKNNCANININFNHYNKKNPNINNSFCNNNEFYKYIKYLNSPNVGY